MIRIYSTIIQVKCVVTITNYSALYSRKRVVCYLKYKWDTNKKYNLCFRNFFNFIMKPLRDRGWLLALMCVFLLIMTNAILNCISHFVFLTYIVISNG